MNQFLVDKFCNFTKEIYVEFNTEISKNLPFIGHFETSFRSAQATIWGDLNPGFWFVNRFEGKLFENDGIIHNVDFWRTESQYKIITDLYEANKTENIFTMAEPLIFEKHILEIDNHGSENPKGTEVYYTKFKIPAGAYGLPASHPSWDFSTTEKKLKYADKMIALLALLKKIGHPFCDFDLEQQTYKYENDILFMPNMPFNRTESEVKTNFENSNNDPDVREYVRNYV
jgi:hypothetical protein